MASQNSPYSDSQPITATLQVEQNLSLSESLLPVGATFVKIDGNRVFEAGSGIFISYIRKLAGKQIYSYGFIPKDLLSIRDAIEAFKAYERTAPSA